MADISITVTHTVQFGSDQTFYRSRAVPGVEVCIANDLLCTDGRTNLVIKRRSEGSYDPLAGAYDQGTTIEQTIRANKTQVTLRELQQSNAFLSVRDVKFRVAASQADWTPDKGDIVTDLADGKRYEIIAVDIQVLGTQILCWCRDV